MATTEPEAAMCRHPSGDLRYLNRVDGRDGNKFRLYRCMECGERVVGP